MRTATRSRWPVKLAALACLLLTACGYSSRNYTDYVQAVLDCTYHGDTVQYIALTGASEDSAQAVWDAETGEVCELLYLNWSIRSDCLSEETRAACTDTARLLMDKVQYHVQTAVRSGGSYAVTVVAQPLDCWVAPQEAVDACFAEEFYDSYAAAYRAGDAQALAAVEDAYAMRVTEILTEYLADPVYREPQSVVLQVTADDNGHSVVTGWQAVDRALLSY